MVDDTKGLRLVTGASGALGSSLVARFAGQGVRVLGLERSRDGSVRLEPQDGGVARLHAPSDDARALQNAVAKAEAELGPIEGAVLTAGTWRGGHRFHEPEAEPDFRAVMDANLQATSNALRAILPGMVARGRGSIVLIGSRSGVRPYSAAGSAAYAASKAALDALVRAIAAEVLEAGVRINSVLPSTIDTEANRRAMPSADRARWVSLESLGDVIQFLLSPAARDISGALIPVYGRDGV